MSQLRVFHLTTLENLDSILKEGVLSREKVMEAHPEFKDIAAPGALGNHAQNLVEGNPVDAFARCFFNPLPPMYYNRDNEGIDDLCVVELRIPIEQVERTYSGRRYTFDNLCIEGVRGKDICMFKESIASISKKGSEKDLSSARVRSISQIRWLSGMAPMRANPEKTKACRGAELLVLERIPASYIVQVYSNLGIEGHHPIAELEPLVEAERPSTIEE